MSSSWLAFLVPGRIRRAWRYRRGMLRAKNGQHDAALEDYGRVIDDAQVGARELATALYNRALVHDARGDQSAAISDLKRLLLVNGAGDHVKTEARRRLLRMEQRRSRQESAAGA